jgi:glycosyltransferase involved in cell wall biosynthesis
MRINAVVAQQLNLSLNRGDVLSEVKLLRRFSQFAEVHYNEQRVVWSAPNFGLKSKNLTLAKDNYDIHYFRNNNEMALKTKGFRLVHGYPYHEELFTSCEALLVSTHSWKQYLEELKRNDANPRWASHWYPRHIEIPSKIVVAEQSVSNHFREEVNSREVSQWRMRLGGEFVGGYIGRIDPDSFPNSAYVALQKIKQFNKAIKFWFFGEPRVEIDQSETIRVWGPVSNQEIPSVLRALDFCVYDQDATGNWLGSAKVIEAMTVGTPILCRDHRARREVLGDGYPLYYSSYDEFVEKLAWLYSSPTASDTIRKYLLERSPRYFEENVALRLENQIRTLW